METEASSIEIYAYNINKDVFDSAYEMLRTGQIEITDYSDTRIEGEVNAGFDGTLYSSIPFDEGWQVTVDGETAETFKIGDSLLGVHLKQGKHKITYRYSPKGLNYGAVISGAAWLCAVVFGIYRVLVRKSKLNNCKK